MSVLETFLASAKKHGDRPYLMDETGVLGYQRVASSALRFAALLGGATARPHVGIMLPNVKEFGVVFYAVLAAGKTPVPLNYLLEQPELDFIYEDADLDTVITVEFFRPKVEGRVANVFFLENLAAMAKSGALDHAPGPDPAPQTQLALILYTSGSIGRPKGVMLSNANLLHNARSASEAFGLDGSERFVGVLPLFHTFAITGLLLVPMLSGISVYFFKKFVPAAVLAAIREQGLTHMLAVASMYRFLARAARRDPPPTLRVCVAGGEPLTEQTRHDFDEVFRFPLLEGYGLTEHAPIVSLSTQVAHRAGTAGPLIPGVQCRIVDDDGRDLPRGAEGEIWVRSPSVMLGYFKKPDDTRDAVTPDGWLRTGDLGRYSADGFLAITGRKKELIISSGENIAPAEIEQALVKHPAVLEAAVIGVPDESRGEVPKAFVSLQEGRRATESELRAYLEPLIAAYKLPRVFEILPDLPHGPTGKILKRKLKEMEAAKPVRA
ncbi:MAG: AMP-binding protein [Planctomycetes bacterium]|nr:AMP-binding protein [Planctomycetota bacterium]